MLISNVIGTIDNSAGGPSRSVTQLISQMGQSFPELRQILHTARSEEMILSGFECLGASLKLYKQNSIGQFSDFLGALNTSKTDLFHAHTIWGLPMHQMALIARKSDTHYIISPRGMLEPWALQQKKFKKKMALWLYQRKDLECASCLHATSEMEAKNLRSLGFKNPIAIIPNGIPLEEFEVKTGGDHAGAKKLLFLSRLHPKKGIELLLEAWAGLSPELKKDWSIEIVGNGAPVYIEQLHRLKMDLGLSNQVTITGPVYGSEKIRHYQEASLFVLPTYSENFGIVVAEALACGVPVITTYGAPWQELESARCGWWIDIGVEPLKLALQRAITLPSEELFNMGLEGRKLIERKYSIEAVAKQMYKLYQWILGKGEKPEFVLEME